MPLLIYQWRGIKGETARFSRTGASPSGARSEPVRKLFVHKPFSDDLFRVGYVILPGISHP